MENSNEKSSKVLNVILWIAQLLLAGHVSHGRIHEAATPVDQLAASNGLLLLPFQKFSSSFIGVSEIAGRWVYCSLLCSHQATTHCVGSQGSHPCDDPALAFHVSRGDSQRSGQIFFLAPSLFLSPGVGQRKQSSMLVRKTEIRSSFEKRLDLIQ